jgi:two-component system sensor histidine kinase PilS (NtrC family)
MLLAAPAEQAPTPMDASAGVRDSLRDWQRTQPEAQVQASVPTAVLSVSFEPEHLRRVLINLLDNGWRHAQALPQPWVRVELRALDGQRALLRVSNPSPPLPPHIEQHLFEPFHSTRSRSSGLGLYICRELCERYGARIEYQALEVEGRQAVSFSVTLRRST